MMATQLKSIRGFLAVTQPPFEVNSPAERPVDGAEGLVLRPEDLPPDLDGGGQGGGHDALDGGLVLGGHGGAIALPDGYP